MKLNIITIGIFASALILASCNSTGSKDKEESTAKDSLEMNHEEMVEEASKSKELTVPLDAKVFFVNIKDGDALDSPVAIIFGVEGMEVEPAGELHQGKGHHHLIIDGEPLAKGVVVPADSLNIHYGKGQTETELVLSPGEHTLVMQFADGYHQSYGEQMSAKVTFIVNE